MKPAPFEYVAPSSVDECLRLLVHHGDDAKLLAGGQSLVPLMNLRFAAPSVLVDLNRIPDLAYVREDGDTIAVGAMTRHHDVARSELVQRRCPLLAEAAALIGYPAIRQRGTIGGSLAHADPAAELPCAVLALEAEVDVAGPDGVRTVAAEDLFVSHFTTVLEPTELVREARVPALRPGEGWSFVEFSRKTGDFAIVAVAVLHGAGRTRIAVGGVGERPLRVPGVEAALAGGSVTGGAGADVASEIAAAVGGGLDPYRAHLVETLAQRALVQAEGRAA